ncbi:cysteinyl-tRNA synthetase, partial [Rhizophlyctis rosea]
NGGPTEPSWSSKSTSTGTDRGSVRSLPFERGRDVSLPEFKVVGSLGGEEPVGGDGVETRMGVLRLFRRDSTFATISASENVTTHELLQIMSKKSLIPDYTKFTICILHRGQERMLNRTERPLLIQRRLLEDVGYDPIDKIEMMGREDNSYLVKFIFKEVSTGNEIDPNYWKAPSFDPRYISLSRLGLTTIPVSLFRLAGDVLHLDLSANPNISDIPNDLAQSLHQLRFISLSENGLTRFPKTLQFVETLSEVDLSHNRITTLEGSGVESIVTLQKLKLTGNLIERVPEDLPRNCQRLQVLELGNNRFRSFPVDLCRYLGQSLRVLDLSYCRIKGKIPDAIGELRKLEVLKVCGNRMYGGLPWRLGELSELVELDLRGNSFGNMGGEEGIVVEVLGRLQGLRTVRLDANRIR